MDEVDSTGRAAGSNGRSKLPSLADHALQFLSTASNETLCACFAGLGAATYLILGRVGLLLIGIACGVVVHATWENGTQTRDGLTTGVFEARRKQEAGIEVLRRVLDWRDEKIKGEEGGEEGNSQSLAASSSEASFASFPEATRAALVGLVDAVIRDYIKWWYDPTLWAPDESFPMACRQTLNQFLLAISSHLSRKRPADTFLNFFTNTTAIFVTFLGELSGCLMTADSVDLEPREAIRAYLEERPSSRLAVMLDVGQQRKRSKEVADHILQSFLDRKALQCDPARIFLREVLGGIILETSARTCSQPEWINGWIVALLEEGEPDILHAIDAGVGGMPVKDLTNGAGPGLAIAREHGAATGSAATLSSQVPRSEPVGHRRQISQAEDAMENAMQEAQRLTEMIAQEDAKRTRSPNETISGNLSGNNLTPTSSQSDLPRLPNESPASSTSNTARQLGADGLEPEIYSNFDQILASSAMEGLASVNGTTAPTIPPLTLQNASVVILDDSQPGEKASIRTKPTLDYLLQIEPASSNHQGWMIARKYTDFETLHEVLRRISVISGVSDFTLKYGMVPTWKGQTKDSLRISLEQYLHVALSHYALAESEGMKRFLEKDQTQTRVAGKGLLGFPNPETFQSMGKGMLDVLSNAPKGAAGGSKALFEGVTGVFGQKRSSSSARATKANRSISMGSGSTLPESHNSPPRQGIMSDGQVAPDDFQEMSLHPTKVLTMPSLPHRPISIDQQSTAGSELSQIATDASRHSSSVTNPEADDLDTATSLDSSTELPAHLPPPPSEIPDDYTSSTTSPRISNDTMPYPSSVSSQAPSLKVSSRQETSPSTVVSSPSSSAPPLKKKDAFPPLSEEETQVAVELFFAVINELYTLSSAWNIRRTLLNAAKAFLLRPGNPNLEAIRILLQDTLVDANTSDAGLAAHLTKLRENTMPTEAERALWPAPLTADEKERLRSKARRLLIEKGMPQALTSVMGAAASGEALARVFDALQVEEVARGLMSALLLQGVRALTH